MRTIGDNPTQPTAATEPRLASGTPPRGFTLIELLLVIAIIGILIGITAAVGASAANGGKARQTADTIRVVDQAVATYFSQVGTAPPAFVTTFSPLVDSPFFEGDDFAAYPLVDGVDMSAPANPDRNRTTVNSIGLFMRALDDAGLGDTLAGVDEKLITRWDGDVAVVEPDVSPPDQQATSDFGRQPEFRTILDGWGRPLRFVHPAFDGIITEQENAGNPRQVGQFGDPVLAIWGQGTPPDINDTSYWLRETRTPYGFDPTVVEDFPIRLIRRDRLTDADRENWSGPTGVTPIGDADGGYVTGGIPYIYSAGEDGDPSLTDDNVYTVRPRFPID